MMPAKSKYVLLVENLSSVTRSSDIKHEFVVCGTVREVERDAKSKSALVDMKRSADAYYAWKKMDNFKMDGKRWRVEYANKDDFKFFGWPWTEGHSVSRSPTPARLMSAPRSDRSD